MAQEKGGETPLEKFARFKNDTNEWEREMDMYKLVEEEKEVLRKHLSISSGLCITQEQFMMLVQEPLLGGHDLLWADRLRKAVSKKKIEEFEQCEAEFYQTIKDKNLSYNFCDYVWRVLISMNKGYGFNALSWRTQA